MNPTKRQREKIALSLQEVCDIAGLSKPTLWRIRRTDPTFPKPVLLSKNPKIMKEDFLQWMRSKQEGVCRVEFSDIPKSWLIPIEDEKPVTAEEWLASANDNPCDPYDDYEMIKAFKAGEKNNELRHRETKAKTTGINLRL